MANATQLTLDSTVIASKDQISSELTGEVVILDLKRGVYHGLNPTGARIWELIQQPRTVVEIRDALVGEYAVDAARIQRDVFALLGELADKQLLEILPASVGPLPG